MWRFCAPRSNRPSGCWGIILLIGGLALLMISLPTWVWMSMLGAMLMVAGAVLLTLF